MSIVDTRPKFTYVTVLCNVCYRVTELACCSGEEEEGVGDNIDLVNLKVTHLKVTLVIFWEHKETTNNSIA